MSILFFDFMSEHIKIFKSKIPHIQIAKTVEECINKLEKDDCSILFLGMNEYKNGKIVEWIVNQEPVIRQVIIYSDISQIFTQHESTQFNIKTLQKFKYKAEYIDFFKLIERLEDFKS